MARFEQAVPRGTPSLLGAAKLDVFLAGDNISTKKPDPLIYTTALEMAGIAPAQTVVIEDSLIGLKAAKGANCGCLVTFTDSTKGEKFFENGANTVMPDLEHYGVTFDDFFNSAGCCEGKRDELSI